MAIYSSAAYPIVVLKVYEYYYGLDLVAVERIIPLVDYAFLPEAPHFILGVVQYHGLPLPLVSLRRRFGLPDGRPALSDHIVLAATPRRRVALLADEVCGFEEVPATAWQSAESLNPAGTGSISSVATVRQRLVLIHDIEKCLSAEDDAALAAALRAPHAPAPVYGERPATGGGDD